MHRNIFFTYVAALPGNVDAAGRVEVLSFDGVVATDGLLLTLAAPLADSALTTPNNDDEFKNNAKSDRRTLQRIEKRKETRKNFFQIEIIDCCRRRRKAKHNVSDFYVENQSIFVE